ncbi:MAG: hypothetical protein ACRD2Z_04010 [Thermoanaerobaculia bacterium]
MTGRHHAKLAALFPPPDVAAVEEAIGRAEACTSAQIVAWVSPTSGEYPEAPLRGALLGAVLALSLLALRWWLAVEWSAVGPLQAIFPPLAGAAVGYAAARWVAPLRRLLIGRERLEAAVRRAAESAFLTAGVFATRQRTGLLIYVSLFEHLCLVLPDLGVRERVEEGERGELARRVAEGVRGGRPAVALVDVIERFGRLLEEKGLAVAAGDIDELPDTLRLEEP